MDSYQISLVFVIEAESIDDALEEAKLDLKTAEKVSVTIEKLEEA